MSDINWDEAPEGATHYDTRIDVYPWLKEDDNGNQYWHHGRWVSYGNDIGVNDSIFARPSPKPTYTQAMVDAGELPSVGMECQYKLKGGVNWFRCKVIAFNESRHLNDAYIWVDNLTAGSHPLINLNSVEFKPLTPPIELICGEPYEFDYHNGNTGMQGAVMRYHKFSDSFFFDNITYKREHCTNIVLLTPEK
jgi:hypothetical protein